MAFLTTNVSLDLRALRKYEQQIREGSPATRRTLQQWGDMHREWLRDRYLRNSTGGGTWPELSPITVRKKGFATILIETKELFDKLTYRRINMRQKSVAVGFSEGIHGDRDKSIKELVGYHQRGTANMPARPILVPPSHQQMKKMIKVAEDLLGKEARRMNPSL